LALIWFGAIYLFHGGAAAAYAVFGDGAEAAVITRRAVVFGRVGADPSLRITGAGDVAVIERLTDNVFASTTISVHAAFSCAACVFVIAGDSVDLGMYVAKACCWIAYARFCTGRGIGAIYCVSRRTFTRCAAGF